MKHARTRVGSLALTLGFFATANGQAASLTKVDDWGASGVPSTVSMYLYVPDRLATKPPVLVLSHYCSGTAAGVFGQATGLVEAADQYGFIIVVPQTSNNCWDVGSTQALTHDGGGDTQAIAQMVAYTITTYSANADRVYATGDSSGAMMTQGLLAVYPEIFKAGSAFAGVPAGCWAVGNPDGAWSSQCAGGDVTHTPAEWGELARNMYGSYTGHRPRVQLFHGDADATIDYENHTEAIKQWTNVLGLATDPTTTETVTLGSHQATRQQWEDDCGYVVLDAFTSIGGDHGPGDALFEASFVVPFFALDDTDDVDPEIAQCGSTSGGGGIGGASTGGTPSSGGVPGSGGALGGATDTLGGMSSSGGVNTSGGVDTIGGVNAIGGVTTSGGNTGTGGSAAGAPSSPAGSAGTGTGGTTPAMGDMGMSTTGGSNAGQGATTTGGSTSSESSPAGGSGGGCRTTSTRSSSVGGLLTALAAIALLRRRRRPTKV